MLLIVRTVADGQYVVKVETTLVTVVVPNDAVAAVPELTLEEEDTAVPETTVLLDRVLPV